MSDMKLPTPSVNAETEPFWEGTSRGVFLIKKCTACGEVHYYPRTMCPFCHSDATQWVEASGKGRIYSFSTLRRTRHPFTLAYVTLAEGVSVLTNIIDCDPDTISIDDEVEVTYRENEDGYHLPFFKPI
jgi:uncharacterized OB-fold protein